MNAPQAFESFLLFDGEKKYAAHLLIFIMLYNLMRLLLRYFPLLIVQRQMGGNLSALARKVGDAYLQ